MIIQLKDNITATQFQEIQNALKIEKINSSEVKTQLDSYLIGIAEGKEFDIRKIGNLSGVRDIHRVTTSVKLVSSQWKLNPTEIKIGKNVSIGNGHFQMMAGPCSIEGEEQIESTVDFLLKNNIKIMRGGVFKPRSSPYAFRGLGIDGLKLFYKHCSENGIKIITEVMQSSQIEEMYDYVDVFQVGARNSQNFNLLDELGQIDKPVLLKRGISGSIDELLSSAEYVFSGGNEKIILCERGIRTFEKAYRNTLDLNAVPILKEKSHLPVVVDPSHGIGVRNHVATMALASVVAGADGLLIEAHQTPEKAFSDSQQTLSYQEMEKLLEKIELVRKAIS